MGEEGTDTHLRRILLVVPNWVGDVVMATPVFAAMRERFAHARITFLMRRYVAEVVDGGGWNDDVILWPDRRGLAGELKNFRLARQIRGRRFDLAVLLTNSFRSAAVTWLGGVARRIGFARDGRGWMLTDGLRPLRANGRFVPTPAVQSYARIAEAAGCPIDAPRLRLTATVAQDRAADELRRSYGLDDGRPYAVINPGAAFGAAKCWLPERFAEVCDRIEERFGYRSVIVGAPREIDLMRDIARRTRSGATCCDDPCTTLGSLKGIIRDAALLVCNDTGPRHYGLAYDVPTLTIFGPTHQAWTDTQHAREVKLQVSVPCGPCQLRTCPLDHRCMTRITSEMVVEHAAALREAS